MFTKDFLGRNIKVSPLALNSKGLIPVLYESSKGNFDVKALILSCQIGYSKGMAPMPEPLDWPREGRIPPHKFGPEHISKLLGFDPSHKTPVQLRIS